MYIFEEREQTAYRSRSPYSTGHQSTDPAHGGGIGPAPSQNAIPGPKPAIRTATSRVFFMNFLVFSSLRFVRLTCCLGLRRLFSKRNTEPRECLLAIAPFLPAI